MDNKVGVIYILTNPSFPEYVKIGYADNIDKRLKELNRSECIPFAFRVYATYEVNSRLSDLKIHTIIDKLNPNLRSIDNFNGQKRVREFYAMSPEDAYSILEAIAEIHGCVDKLTLVKPSEDEIVAEETAQEIVAERKEKAAPFRFSMCDISVGEEIEFWHRTNPNSGKVCTVFDDRRVRFEGQVFSLSALASLFLGFNSVAGPSYFKYHGEWLNELRAKAEGRTITSRHDDVWIIPCNPKYYDVVAAFDNLDVIEWSQPTSTTVGDTVYIYVGEKYKSIMYKCEVIAADLFGNRSSEDHVYYNEMSKDPDARYMKLRLIEKYPAGQYPLKDLRENGLTSVQGRSKATVQLMKYLADK